MTKMSEVIKPKTREPHNLMTLVSQIIHSKTRNFYEGNWEVSVIIRKRPTNHTLIKLKVRNSRKPFKGPMRRDLISSPGVVKILVKQIDVIGILISFPVKMEMDPLDDNDNWEDQKLDYIQLD